MRKPINRSDRQRLTRGTYTFGANAAFAASQSETDPQPGYVGARVGDHVLVSPATGSAAAGLHFWGYVNADNYVTVACTNVTNAAINRPSTAVNIIVLPK